MPQITNIRVTYKRKLNLGDFNSAEVGCEVEAALEPEEDVQQVLDELRTIARESVKAQALPLLNGRPTTQTIRNLFAGKEVEQQST